jgi:hypothetical protein
VALSRLAARGSDGPLTTQGSGEVSGAPLATGEQLKALTDQLQAQLMATEDEAATGDNEAATPAYILLNDQPATGEAADCLGTYATARKLVDVLLASKRSSPFVLAVNGAWGIGKSTLLQEMYNQLRASEHSRRRDSREASHIRCVQFNAWTAEDSRVLENLIAAVLGELDPHFLRRWAHKLARRRGLMSALQITFTVSASFFGLSRAVNELMASLSVSARSRSEMRDLIQEVLSNWLDSSGQGNIEGALVVFVDDIDRCSDETVVQMCEAIKLYLDMPGLIFVLACDLTVLARGVSSVTGGSRGQAFNYLEKIIQVAYRVPTPDDAQIIQLIKRCSRISGTEMLIDGENDASKALAEGTQRNPRRIKRIINSFILEYTLHPGWAEPPLGVEYLIRSVLLYLCYPSFYDVFIGDDYSSDDPIGDFLAYVNLSNHPGDDDSDWRTRAEKVFKYYHGTMRAENPTEALEQLRKVVPEPLPDLIRDQPLIALLKSMGDAATRQAIRDQLINSPLSTDRRLTEPPMIRDLLGGIFTTADEAAASSVAQAAQHKMQTNPKLMEGFDQVLSS